MYCHSPYNRTTKLLPELVKPWRLEGQPSKLDRHIPLFCDSFDYLPPFDILPN